MNRTDASADAVSTAARWRPAEGVIWQAGEDALFVLDTAQRDPRPLRLDGGAMLIWEGLVAAGPVGAEVLVAAVAEQTGERPDSLAPVVAAFLDELRAAALIEPA